MATIDAASGAATAVNPGPLIRMTIADCSAKVLHSAIELGVFTAVADGPVDAARICAQVGLHPRLAADFLDALAALGLLQRTEPVTATRRWPRRIWCRDATAIWAASST